MLNQFRCEVVIIYYSASPTTSEKMRPLDGITVLDLTRLLPGGAATLLFANFGAEVIKIEEPRAGYYERSMPPFLDGKGRSST